MKFLHIADLHIGKILNAFPLLADQEYALGQIAGFVRAHSPDAVVIAGDVYDKAVPAPEAVRLFDRFLTEISGLGPAVLIVSGNHDSPERLGFGGDILKNLDVHMYGVFDGHMRVVTLRDAYGEVDFYMLPYIRPSDVRRFAGDSPGAIYPAQPIETYVEAVRTVVKAATVGTVAAVETVVAVVTPTAAVTASSDTCRADDAERTGRSRRRVLVAHQFVAAEGADPERSESERETVGGTDRVDPFASGIADGFDYVALGHLHGPQRAGAAHIRYSGSPLKYSFSECAHKKAALLVELGENGRLTVTPLPITPLRDMRRVRGPLETLISVEVAALGDTSDYIHATLTDEDEIYDALGKLRAVYPNIMSLEYDNRRSRADFAADGDADPDDTAPLPLFEEFFALQNGTELGDARREAVRSLLDAEEGPVPQ